MENNKKGIMQLEREKNGVMQIRIHTTKNGFILYHLTDSAPSLAQATMTYQFSNEDVLVFETFKGLVGYLEKCFNPIIVVPDEALRGVVSTRP